MQRVKALEHEPHVEILLRPPRRGLPARRLPRPRDVRRGSGGVHAYHGRRDETCPISTGGGTRRVHLVREGGGGEVHAYYDARAEDGVIGRKHAGEALVRAEGGAGTLEGDPRGTSAFLRCRPLSVAPLYSGV